MNWIKIAIATAGAILLLPLITSAGNAAGVAALSYLDLPGYPLGMRNNNPGNIRRSANSWKGKIPDNSGAFERFYTYAWGIRAMIKQLLTYHSRGLNTISKIIYTWAPPSDNNDTAAYVQFVANRTGVDPDTPLNLRSKTVMGPIVRAMAQMENFGGNEQMEAVTAAQFNYAWTIV